jgi:hypothetical protein
MVPDSPDVDQVLPGEGGVFDNAPSGALVIDFSSIRPDVSAALAEQGSWGPAPRAALSCTWTSSRPQIGRVFAPDYSIVSDARAALEVFVEVAGEWVADGRLADRSAWAQECRGRKQTLQRKTGFDQRQARAPARSALRFGNLTTTSPGPCSRRERAFRPQLHARSWRAMAPVRNAG